MVSGIREATTEPIPIVGDTVSRPERESRSAEVPETRAPETRGPEKQASPKQVPGKQVPLTPAAARRNLRQAQRARKQYERQEVRRFTWRSRRRTRSWLIAGGILVALVVFVVVGAYSPLMALRTIEVSGTSRVLADQVQSALSGQLGTPLPLIDADRVKRDLAQFTLIQSFVTESRPPGTLVVRIVERQPVGAIAPGDDAPDEAGFELVDAAGVVIQSSPERPEGYPIIDAGTGPGSAGFRSAAAVVAALPESIRTQLDTVTAATKDDVTLTLTSGATVVWGSPERTDYKAVVLAALLVGNPPGSVDEYDVTSPDSAVVR